MFRVWSDGYSLHCPIGHHPPCVGRICGHGCDCWPRLARTMAEVPNGARFLDATEGVINVIPLIVHGKVPGRSKRGDIGCPRPCPGSEHRFLLGCLWRPPKWVARMRSGATMLLLSAKWCLSTVAACDACCLARIR